MNIKGFTIIETLIAVAILMIAIVGPLTIAHRGLIAAITAREQITANYLAQDAMEYLKNIRDGALIEEDVAAGEFWWIEGVNDNGLECNESPTPSKRCTIDTITGTQAECSGSSNCGLLYLDSEQRFTHANTGNPSDCLMEERQGYQYYIDQKQPV